MLLPDILKTTASVVFENECCPAHSVDSKWLLELVQQRAVWLVMGAVWADWHCQCSLAGVAARPLGHLCLGAWTELCPHDTKTAA